MPPVISMDVGNPRAAGLLSPVTIERHDSDSSYQCFLIIDNNLDDDYL